MAEVSAPPEVRLNPDGSLDEVVAEGATFHLEQMGGNMWWLCVESGGKRVAVWLSTSRSRITATYEETASAAVRKPGE